MPKETITKTFVDNGPDASYTNTLAIGWGAKGDAPDAPDGWVNQGFAHIAIIQDKGDGSNPDSDHYIELTGAALDSLIRKLKRIRRKTFEAEMPSEEMTSREAYMLYRKGIIPRSAWSEILLNEIRRLSDSK